jgi:predicted molibdopterin-dependent oxidoreductase YjgC
MMGVCFDCLMEIDGEANQQACMTTVRDGMRVARQRGAPKLDTSE